MSVTNVRVHTLSTGPLMIECVKYGIEWVHVDTEGSSTYVDLFGDDEKAKIISESVGAEVLDVTVSIPGEPEGVGVPSDLDDDDIRQRVYGFVSQAPRF